jgi:hypothetical protein
MMEFHGFLTFKSFVIKEAMECQRLCIVRERTANRKITKLQPDSARFGMGYYQTDQRRKVPSVNAWSFFDRF